MPDGHQKPAPLHGHPLCRRVLVVFVLLGYLFVLYGSSAGHGWRLLVHLAKDHQTPAAPAEEKILRTLNPEHIPKPHAHSAGSHHHDTDHTHTTLHQPVTEYRVTDFSDALHNHNGVLHTHEPPADSDETLIALLLLDHPSLFVTHTTALPPPARALYFSYTPAPMLAVSRSVDAPPPRLEVC